MNTCPHCGNSVDPGVSLCPHCGAALPPAPAPAWPLPPVDTPSFNPYAPQASKLVTGRSWTDIVLGVVLTLVSMFVGGVGLIAMPIVYYVVRPNFPVFARGVGYTLVGIWALLLGAVALCFYDLGRT